MTWRGKVPFDQRGNQLHYADYPYDFYFEQADDPNRPPVKRDVAWKQAFEFDADLKIIGMQSGRSAKYLLLQDVDTQIGYTLFITDLVTLAQTATIRQGVISGHWGFRKRGNNFGVEYLRERG